MGFEDFQQATHVSLQMRIPAALSIFGTSLVIFTYLKFKILRKLRYIELAFYCAIGDFFGSIGAILGDTDNEPVSCWIQGLFVNYFFLVSIFWSTVIAYQLYVVVHTGKQIKNMTFFHFVCWGFPLITTFLPLSTNIYAQFDDDHSAWCVVRDKMSTPSWGEDVWGLLSFYVWLWLCVFSVISLYTSIALRARQIGGINSSSEISKAVRRMALYPIIIAVCWVFPTVAVVNLIITDKFQEYQGSYIVDIGSNILPPLQGVLLSIVFFLRNDVVSDQWRAMLNLTTDLNNDYLLPFQESTSTRSGAGNQTDRADAGRGSNFTLSDGSIWSSVGSKNSIVSAGGKTPELRGSLTALGLNPPSGLYSWSSSPVTPKDNLMESGMTNLKTLVDADVNIKSADLINDINENM